MKIGKKARIFIFTNPIQHCSGRDSHCKNQEKELKGPQFEKEIKLTLSVYDMIPDIENLKQTMKKLTELISEFSMISGYKVNVQK